MALILDTNALSAVADGEDSAIELVARAERLAVPVIVLGEYRLGIAQSRQKASYESWLRQWIAAVLVLEITILVRPLRYRPRWDLTPGDPPNTSPCFVSDVSPLSCSTDALPVEDSSLLAF